MDTINISLGVVRLVDSIDRNGNSLARNFSFETGGKVLKSRRSVGSLRSECDGHERKGAFSVCRHTCDRISDDKCRHISFRYFKAVEQRLAFTKSEGTRSAFSFPLKQLDPVKSIFAAQSEKCNSYCRPFDSSLLKPFPERISLSTQP